VKEAAMRHILAWFETRLKLRESVLPLLEHPIPRSVDSPMGWWYVFGSASLTMLAVQIITGILLALVFVPSADKAYDSLLYLNFEQPLGWFLRALHYYAGSGMVVMVLLHMAQVFLQGAYKYPRELTWVLGVLLLLCTLGMFFTGQVLRWDPDAYWGVAVGASMAGRVPVIGPYLVHLLLGGPVIGGDTLSRFFTLHVFLIPGALLFFLVVHLWLVLKLGVSEAPVPGQVVDPNTYDAHYETELQNGVPFLGRPMLRDALMSALAVLLVLVLTVVIGPKGPSGPPDPTLSGANPRPEWPFLWLFALLSLSPPSAETFIMLVFPVILIVALFAVPFVSRRGERAPSRRPVAVLFVLVLFTTLGVLTYEGVTAPWSPKMTAWSGDPVPKELLKKRSPRQLQGAAVLQIKQCRNCHALEGIGGQRGPDLSGVGERMTRDQLIDQISNGTPGGGNMPAFRKEMTPAEMDTLIDFLTTLRASGQPVAEPPTDVAGPAVP
jgi:ubiquinol-cytochrome c reductase cytochrome b subunit